MFANCLGQGCAELNIGAQGPSSSSVHANTTDHPNDNDNMVTQISCLAGRLVDGTRGLKSVKALMMFTV